MLTLFAKEKETDLPKEMTDVERWIPAADEISRILREVPAGDRPEMPDHRIFIFQRQF
ncbi:hypothetical protein [Gorillibacterium sp. sgz5001074]|uniref:hypothetical protein n=1 Tax=Gorillibacterium sp. sgz5001074 TaxID=3446695 RepID=UPI003F663A71